MAKYKTDTERILEATSNHGFSTLFRKLEIEIGAGNIAVEHDGDRRIESLRLTEQGAAKLRELQQRAWVERGR